MSADKPTNRARIDAALKRHRQPDAMKRLSPAKGNKLHPCPTCGNWARVNADWAAPHHPDCPLAHRDAGKKKRPGQAERRQKRITALFARLPFGTHMEQTYTERGWLLKMSVPVVEGEGLDNPYVKEFFGTGKDHLPAIEELYLKYRRWLSESRPAKG